MTTQTASTENERDEASTFRIHTGRFVRGARLQAALAKVAEDWRQLAHTIRSEDAYAPHVTEDQKRDALRGMLLQADEIERGNVVSFAIWQRVNTQLTGDCVPLFGPTPRKRQITGRSALRVDDVTRPE